MKTLKENKNKVIGRIIVECGKTNTVIINKLVYPVSFQKVYDYLNPKMFGKFSVGCLDADSFGVALYKVY